MTATFLPIVAVLVPVAVVVDAVVANLRRTRVDQGIIVVAVAVADGKGVPVAVRRRSAIRFAVALVLAGGRVAGAITAARW